MIQTNREAILTRYREELDQLRQDGGAFARSHPAMAGRLGIDPFGCSDPHVERLIESFAWLAARLRLDLDTRLPALAQAMLDQLYPQFTAPMPSMAIAQIKADAAQAQVTAGLEVPAGSELLAQYDSHTIRFATAYGVTLWPLEVTAVDLLPTSAVAAMDGRSDVASVLRIALQATGKTVLDELKPKTLRLHLSGPRNTAMSLYDLLAGHLRHIALSSNDGRYRRLRPQNLVPFGFEAGEAILPTPPQALDAFRLLQEFSHMPEKFLFFELDLGPANALGQGKSVELCFGLAKQPEHRLALDTSSIRLGATPVVNLFNRISEPVRIDHTKLSYRLEPDSRASRSTEIHTVQEVWCRRQQASAADIVPPLFAIGHGETSGQGGHTHSQGSCHWQARRVPDLGQERQGSDILVSFCDRQLDPRLPASDVLFARVLCTNRGLAEKLPGGTRLSIESGLPIRSIDLLARPTRQQSARLGADAIWRLISQLSLNHFSLADSQTGLAALKEILGVSGSTLLGEAIAGVNSEPAVRRLPGSRHVALVHGLDITLTLDAAKLEQTEGSALMLGGILSRFLSRYAAANSFTALTLLDDHSQERIGAWPARAGDLNLI